MGEPTVPFLGWGDGFPRLRQRRLARHFHRQRARLSVGGQAGLGHDLGGAAAACSAICNGKKFQAVPPATGSGLADVITGRGAAFGDLFNDGKLDVVINNIDSPPTLLRNVVKNSNHWVELKLVGGPKRPRDAVGATVFLTAAGIRQRGDVFSGGSYGSSSDQRVHFGLGLAAKVDKIEIDWPSGLRQQIGVLPVDRIITVEEGKPVSEK